MARVAANESSFATALLAELSARTGTTYPATQANIEFVEKWISREGGGGANNPLNTTQVEADSTVLAKNSAGVKNYSSLGEGVDATVTTLINGRYNDILDALQSGDALTADQDGKLAKGLSTWSGGGYASVTNTAIKPVSNVGGPAAAATANGQGADTGTDETSGDIDGFLQTQAPALATAIKNPAVDQLLQAWGQNQISDQEFQDQLEQTTWWKNTPQSQRTLLVQQATDPATAQQTLTNQLASITSLAAQKGIGLTTAQAQSLAVASIKNQWSTQQITEQVAQYAKYQGDITYKGEAATDVNTLRGIYSDYAVPVTDATLNSQLQNVLAGKLTTQAIQDQVADQAATLYASNPQLASFLTSGKGSTAQWAAPYIAQAANLLGESDNNINLTDPRYASILQPWTNPTTGQSTGQAMSLDQWTQQLKTNPTYGYSKTANGVKDYQSLADGIVNAFGGGLVTG